MKIFDELEYIDNTLSKKQREKKKKAIAKWIEEVVVPVINKSKGGRAWCSIKGVIK